MEPISRAVLAYLRRSITENNKVVLDEFGEMRLTTDVRDIIRSLNMKHPIVQLLEDHAKYLHERYQHHAALGTLLLLALLERALGLVHQGLNQGIAPELCDRYWRRALAAYTQQAGSQPGYQPGPQPGHALAAYSRSSLRASLLLSNDVLDRVSNSALQLVGRTCHVVELSGPEVSVTALHRVSVLSDSYPITCSDIRVLCVRDALAKLGEHVIEVLALRGPDLLLCTAIDPRVKQRLALHGIIALTATAEQIMHVAALSGGTMHESIEHVITAETPLGHVSHIDVEFDEPSNNYHVTFPYSVNQPSQESTARDASLVHEQPLTVLIRAPHPALSQQVKRALLDTITRLTRVNQESGSLLVLSDDTCQTLAGLAPADNELLREIWARAWLELPVQREYVIDRHVLGHVIDAVLHTALKILRVDQVLAM